VDGDASEANEDMTADGLAEKLGRLIDAEEEAVIDAGADFWGVWTREDAVVVDVALSIDVGLDEEVVVVVHVEGLGLNAGVEILGAGGVANGLIVGDEERGSGDGGEQKAQNTHEYSGAGHASGGAVEDRADGVAPEGGESLKEAALLQSALISDGEPEALGEIRRGLDAAKQSKTRLHRAPGGKLLMAGGAAIEMGGDGDSRFIESAVKIGGEVLADVFAVGIHSASSGLVWRLGEICSACSTCEMRSESGWLTSAMIWVDLAARCCWWARALRSA